MPLHTAKNNDAALRGLICSRRREICKISSGDSDHENTACGPEASGCSTRLQSLCPTRPLCILPWNL